MNNYLQVIRSWYDARNVREKLLVLALSWALLYALFSFFLFRPIDAEKIRLETAIKDANNDIKNWHLQITALKKIPQTPLYKEWLNQHQSLQSLRGKYHGYINEPPSKQWADVIRAILQSHNNINLVEIKNSPETAYHPPQAQLVSKKLFQQQLQVVVNSNYADTILYLNHLEKVLPNLHWNKLTYTVLKYPLAKVEMEFSIIYEKS